MFEKVYPQDLRTYSMNEKSLRANFLKSDLVAGFSISSDFIQSLQRNVEKIDFIYQKIKEKMLKIELFFYFELSKESVIAQY